MEINNNRFEECIRQVIALLEQLHRLMKARNRLNGETILDNQDICLMFNLTPRSLQRYRSSGQLPFIRIGGKIFYLESDVEKFIQQRIDKNTGKGNIS